MKPAIIKAALIATAAALVVVSVEAQQSIRASKRTQVLDYQDLNWDFRRSGGGGTTGGNGGVIVGPAPTVLSPITVAVPRP